MTTALLMRILRDSDVIHQLRIEREQAETVGLNSARELNHKVCAQEKTIKKLRSEYSRIEKEINEFELTHKRKDGIAEENQDLTDQVQKQAHRISWREKLS
jgi:archaellum component FlaC